MTTRKLCDRCAQDTAVKGRCSRLERIDRPGTICDRCLSDGRLLVSYLICCEPETRFGHTTACKAEQKLAKGMTHPTLQRFATALFCTDPRVLTLVGNAMGDGLWDGKGTCLALDKSSRIERLGRAWDLAADGHEPEATYRKEAEGRAFAMQQWDRELTEYGIETKRLTRESERKAALKTGQEANAKLAPPLSRAEHSANLTKFRAEEEERNRQSLARYQADDAARAERSRLHREEQKAAHPQCGAKSPIGTHPDFNSMFGEERCTRQKHDYGDHQFIVNGRVISGWNANAYYVGEDQARATSRTQRSAVPSHLLRDAHLEENAQVITRDPPPAGDVLVRDLPNGDAAKVIGSIDKNAMVAVITFYDAAWALVYWKGTEKRPAIKGYVRRAYLAENVKRGGDLRENGGRIDTTIPPMWTRGRPST